MNEIILKVGKRGEIYTNKKIRKIVGIKLNSKVKASIEDGRLVIEPIPTIEEIIRKPVIEMRVEDIEKISEEVQKEEGVYG